MLKLYKSGSHCHELFIIWTSYFCLLIVYPSKPFEIEAVLNITYSASTLNEENNKIPIYFIEIAQERNSRPSEESGNESKKYTEVSR